LAFKISIYKGAVVAGDQSGTVISELDWTNALDSGYLLIPETNPSYTEGDWIRLGIRCESGHQTVEDLSRHVRISLDGSNSSYWQLAADNGSGSPSTPVEWNQPLDITTVVTDVNTLFHVRARCADTEIVQNDKTCEIMAQALVGEVPGWTMQFDDVTFAAATSNYCGQDTVLEDCMIYIYFTGTIVPSYIQVMKNGSPWGGYSAGSWINRPFSFVSGDVLLFSAGANTPGYFDIIMRLDDENGRIISSFRYTAT